MQFVLLSSVIIKLAILVSAIPHPAEEGTSMVIPLRKRFADTKSDDVVNFDAWNSYLASMKAKIDRGFEIYEKNTGKPHPLAIKGVGSRNDEPLIVYQDLIWYGAISVGTPPKLFTVQLDTGSSDLIIPTVACDKTCAGHTLWNPKKSSTSRDTGRNFTVAYADASTAYGEQYADTVSIAGLRATAQVFGAVEDYASGFQKSQFPPDGILGMAFPRLSTFRALPVFNTLIYQKKVPNPVFSFKITSKGGELHIGRSDSLSYKGKMTYTPVTHKSFWQVVIDDVRQDNGWKILSSLTAIIDTGTPSVSGPSHQVSKLHEILRGTPATFGRGFYTFPCKSFPNISLTFGGSTFPISALNIGRVSRGSPDCVSGIIGREGVSYWVVGDLFLQGVYTTFDVGQARVGFAQLAA